MVSMIPDIIVWRKDIFFFSFSAAIETSSWKTSFNFISLWFSNMNSKKKIFQLFQITELADSGLEMK